MSTNEKRIKIVIDGSGAKAGAAQVNAALASIGSNSALRGLSSQSNNATAGIIRTGNAAQQMAQQLAAANSNATGLGGSLAQLVSRITGASAASGTMSSILGGMIGAGVVAGIAGLGLTVVGVGKSIIEATATVESFKASLTTVLGDAGKAGAAFDTLAQFAAKTPFSLDQAVDGFIKLKALGLTPSEEAMSSYGNTASAMGKDLNQMIEAVADASTGEFERLKEFGIKASQQGGKVALTFQGVTTTIGNNSADIQKYLMAIGNTQFAGAMERQADTINGALSNIKDQIFLTFAEMGNGGLGDVFKDIVNGLADGLTAIRPLLSSIVNGISGIVSGAISIASGLLSAFKSGSDGASALSLLLDGLTVAFNMIGQVASTMGQVIGGVFAVINDVAASVRDTVAQGWSWLMNKLGVDTGVSMQDIGLKFVGVLRSVKYVALNIPALFKAAVSAVGNVFGILGSRIAAFFQGNWNAFDGFGSAVSAQLAGVKDQAAAIGAEVGKMVGDTKANQAALDRLRGKSTKSTTSLADLAGAAPKAQPSAASGAGKSRSSVEDIAKKYSEFIAKLHEEADLAKVLNRDAEEYKALLEARKILGGGVLKDSVQLTAEQAKQITGLVRQKSLNEAIAKFQNDGFEASNQAIVNGMKRVGLSGREAKVEDALAKYRLDALNKGLTIADITGDQWKLEEAKLAAILRQNAAYDEQAQKLDEMRAKGADLIDQYNRAADPRGAALKDRQDRDASILAAVKPEGVDEAEWKHRVSRALEGSAETFAKDLDEVSRVFRDNMVSAVNQIADAIGGRFGDLIGKIGAAIDSINKAQSGDWSQSGALGGIASLLGGPQGNRNPFGEAVQGGINRMTNGITDALKNPLKSISSSFKGLKDAFDPAAGGSFVKGLGSALGGAMQGAAIGSAVSGVGKMIWGKFSSTGSQVGGAIGSVFGPVGSVVGSVLGGITGGLLKKTKKASQSFTFDDSGKLVLGTLSGNSSSHKDAAAGAGGEVISGIYAIAEQLGADLTAVQMASLGVRHGDYRVDLSGSGITKKKKGAIDFNEDSAGAIALVIADALKKGILTNVSAFTGNLMKKVTTDNMDSLVTLASQYEAVLNDLNALTNPLVAGATSITDALDTLTKAMTEQGATADDLAKVEEYRTLKLNEYIKEQLSSLTDFQSTLTGSAGGYTALSVLNRDLNEFASMRADIAAGKTVDQDSFTTLGQSILSGAMDVYGNTSQFIAIRNMLNDATSGLINNVQNTIDDATVVAIQQQTTEVTDAISITNDYLRQLVESGTITTTQATQIARSGGYGLSSLSLY